MAEKCRIAYHFNRDSSVEIWLRATRRLHCNTFIEMSLQIDHTNAAGRCQIVYLYYVDQKLYMYSLSLFRSVRDLVARKRHCPYYTNTQTYLELNFIDKLLVFRCELIVLLLLQICFFFVMREIS